MKQRFASIFVGLFLASCSSNSTPLPNIDLEKTKVFYSDSHHISVGLFNKSDVKLNDGPIFISKNDINGYDIWLKGFPIGFSKADYDQKNRTYSKTINGDKIILYSQHDLEAYLSEDASPKTGYKYADLLYVEQFDRAGDLKSFSFASYGQKSLELAAQTGKSDYNGLAKMVISKNNYFNGHIILDSQISLSANFATQKISGIMHHISDTRGAYKGVLEIDASKISNSEFVANVASDAAFEADFGARFEGKLNGSFYGSKADEVAGIFSIKSNSYSGVGGFIAGQVK